MHKLRQQSTCLHVWSGRAAVLLLRLRHVGALRVPALAQRVRALRGRTRGGARCMLQPPGTNTCMGSLPGHDSMMACGGCGNEG